MQISTTPSPFGSAEAASRPDAATVFKKMDTQSKGYLTQDEFSSAEVKLSAEGRRLADTPDRPSAQDAFTAMDTDGDGRLTATEFEQAAPKRATDPTSGASGLAPGKGAGGPPAGGAARSPNSDDSSLTYDAADSNQDGTVSLQEQQAYDAEQAQAQTRTSSASPDTQLALQTYQALQSTP